MDTEEVTGGSVKRERERARKADRKLLRACSLAIIPRSPLCARVVFLPCVCISLPARTRAYQY